MTQGNLTATEFASIRARGVMFFADPANTDLISTIDADPNTLAINLAVLFNITDGALGNVEVGALSPVGSMDFTGAVLASHGINFSDITLPASSNVIRGANVNPTRVSGWTSFTGIQATGFQYSDYRELHTGGDAAIVGFGSFPFADDGATIDTMMAYQGICEIDSGATLATRGGDPTKGVHPGWFKVLMAEGSVYETGGRVAPVWSDVQLNGVGAVDDEETFNFLVTSGGSKLRSVSKLESVAGWVNYFELDSEMEPVIAVTGYNDTSGAGDKGLHVKVGAAEYIIPMYLKTP